MFRLDILQYRWLILSLTGGMVLMLGLVLACLAIWRAASQTPPRPTGDKEAQPVDRPRAFMPWFLIVVYVATAAYVVVYTLLMAANPPNW
jgi:hypothetical protein